MAKSIAKVREEFVALQMESVRLEAAAKFSQEKIIDLEKRCNDYYEQILKLQDALIAKEAPAAYSDRKQDENLVERTPDELAKDKFEKELAIANRHLLDTMTEPVFKDATDMIEMLTGGEAPKFLALHDNDEG